VAIAESGTHRVMTSANGVDWVAQTAATALFWSGICYGNGLYVAVATDGTGNRVMTSPNGVDWTSQTSAADSTWLEVCYGNGLFVAIASNGAGVMTSPNGTAWTTRTPATGDSWISVCYGAGLFVAVAFGGGTTTRCMTSPDGITWTTRICAEAPWNAVAYGNGVFAAVASYSSEPYTIMSSGASYPSAVFSDGVFVNVRVIATAAGTTVGLPTDQTVVFTGTTTETYTMPACSLGRKITIKNLSTGTVTVNRAGADTLDETETTFSLVGGTKPAIDATGSTATNWIIS
jgi:hypothetical protein